MTINVPTLHASSGEGPQLRVDRAGSACREHKPWRIVYLDHTASLGGGEIALFNLVTHLDRARYEPVVVLFSDGPLRERLTEHGIETHVLPLDASVLDIRKDSLGLASILKLKQVLRTLRFIPRLAALLRSLRVDLVHTNSLKADLIGGLAARWAGLTVLWHVRDRIDADYLPGPVARVFRNLCRLIPDFVVANSAATLATIRLGESDSGASVPSGIEVLSRTRVVHDGTGEVDGRSPSTAISFDHPIVTLVGRISRWKGQHVFIRAAELVRRRFPATRFQIVGSALFGETAYEQEIRDLAHKLHVEDCMDFMGFRNDVVDVIGRSSIVVHASIMGEPFGQVLIEAMAAERPVVATHGGGVPEIVIEGITGLLVPMGDAAAMAASICHLIDHPELARNMGRYGRQRVIEHFTIQNTVSKMETIYDDLLALPGGERFRTSHLLGAMAGVRRRDQRRRARAARAGIAPGHTLSKYVAAGVAAGLATLVALLLRHLLGAEAPLSLPFLAVVAIFAGFGGARLGAFSAVLGALILACFVFPREPSFAVAHLEQLWFLMFLLVAIFIIVPTYRMHKAQEQMRLAYVQAEAAGRQVAFIARTVTALSSSLDYRSTLANIAYIANSVLSDWCLIDILEGTDIRRILAAHRDPLKRDIAAQLMLDPTRAAMSDHIARVIRSSVPELCATSSPTMLYPANAPEPQVQAIKDLGCRSHMILPFLFGGQSRGAITLVSCDAGRIYTREDLRMANDFAWRSALALDNAISYQSAHKDLPPSC